MRILYAIFVFSLLISVSQAADIKRNDLAMSFVRIPAGQFQMGTTVDDADNIVFEMEKPDASEFNDEQPIHTVTISQDFWLQTTEVTQIQWFQLMHNKPGPKEYWKSKQWKQLPVVSVSWHMAQRFIEELNKHDDKYKYRLPTEAEWEYAARAGSTGIRPYPTKELAKHAWYIASSGDLPHPVGTLEPNSFGLYDMLGNAWEWVNDRYDSSTYSKTNRKDPQGPSSGPSRVRRGGSYHCPLHQTRPGYRSANTPDTAYSVISFRLVAEPLVEKN